MATKGTAEARVGHEQMVVFTLAGEFYSLGIERINTIIRIQDITRVPHTPDYILGVMNLRGMIVPVLDLGIRFGLGATPVTNATRIVVVDNHGSQVGMVVDAVTETIHLPISSIEAFEGTLGTGATEHIRGVGKDGDRLIILLDLDKVLTR